MKLASTLKLQEIHSTAAGTQATTPDSRSADEWIKKYLSDKQKRLNDLRVQLNTLLGPEKGEVHGSWRADKPPIYDQDPRKVAGGGKWAVVSPEGEIISTWQTKEEAERAAYAVWKGILPSSTGATAGARVKKLQAVDVFSDPLLMKQGRKLIGHDKPSIVKLADWLRDGDHRPSSAGGAAGTGGAGGSSGGGGGSS